MKIYTKKEEFWKRYNLNGKAVPVIGYGYRMDYYTDENDTPFKAYLENYNGLWYATDWNTGVRINNCGYKTRKECAAYVEEVANKLPNAVLKFLQEHGNVYDLGIPMSEEEADRAAKVTDNNTAEAEEAENKQEEETMEKQEPKKDYTRFFAGCETLEEAKKLYFKETMQVHPDKGGDTETMQALNAAWEVACKRLNHTHKSMKGETYTTDEDRPFEAPEWFSEFVRAFMGMKGVEIELVGTWLYVKGNSKPYKDTLKAMGFRWSGKKKAWYKIPADYKRPAYKKSGWTMQKCEDTFGVEASYKPQGTQGLPEDEDK